MQPCTGETICDPACGTGGFLLAAHDYIADNYPLDRDQWQHLNHEALHGWEIVDNTARLCVMNLYLHGIGANGGTSPIHVADSLAAHPGEYFDMVLTNPPFGKKSSVTFVTDEGEMRRESQNIVRDDFWTSTSNKQLNFVQHVRSILQQHGRAAVVVPDNVLFEGGAGEVVRRRLLERVRRAHPAAPADRHLLRPGRQGQCALLRPQAGQRDALDEDACGFTTCAPTRTSPCKTNQLVREDLDEFVACYHPENRHDRKATWSRENPEGRWRVLHLR